MHDHDPLDRLAEEVLRRAQHPGAPQRLLDAAEVARRCGVTRGWVYAHAAELGALRLGGGPRPRLRFDPAVVDTALRAGPVPGATSAHRRRKRATKLTENGVELLPVGAVSRVASRHGSRRD